MLNLSNFDKNIVDEVNVRYKTDDSLRRLTSKFYIDLMLVKCSGGDDGRTGFVVVEIETKPLICGLS